MVASIPNDIFQFSTHCALVNGFNQGQPRASDLSTHGNHGIGIFENGHVMMLETGSALYVDVHCHAKSAPPNSRLAFAMVTMFQPTTAIAAQNPTLESIDELLSKVENSGGPNTLIPFKIEKSKFKTMMIHGTSIGKDPSSGELLQNVEGVIFGFMVPKWLQMISGPRVHCYFLSSDRKTGGEAFGFEGSGEVLVQFAKCGRFHLGFPQSSEWEELTLMERPRED